MLDYWYLVDSLGAPGIIPDIQVTELPQAVLSLLRRLRDFGRKERLDDLIEIAEDGKIDAQERESYDDIMDELDDIIQAAMSLKFAKEVKMLTKKEVAERLGVSESTVYRLAKTRRIGVYYVMGSTMRFSEADVEAYLESVKQNAIRYVPAAPASAAQPEPQKPTPTAAKRKRGPGRPRIGVEEVPEYYPGMKVV